MRTVLAVILLFAACATLPAQETREGKVSYITSQHVYVRFASTEGISDGDTLFRHGTAGEVPALVVKNHSSTSCVCSPLGNVSLSVGTPVTGRLKEVASPEAAVSGVEESEVTEKPQDTESPGAEEEAGAVMPEQEIHGRLSLASYTWFKNAVTDGRQRMRYTFSLDADRIAGMGLSAETYVSFSHKSEQWDEIRENIFNGLKIYNLSASYAFSETMRLTAGRKINPRLSSVGAIDGLQLEKTFGSLTAGTVAGFRPDYSDYGFNTGLFQYGFYLAHRFSGQNGVMQNTLAYMEQMNGGRTDRRFVYFQHNNNLVPNLWFFGSVEADLYQAVDGEKKTVFNLYNTYVTVRYRVIRELTLSLSYSARKNLVYYESYKDFLDRLLDDPTLQGWRFRISARPVPYLYAGAHASYRYRKDDPATTRNVHGYVTWARVPALGVSVTGTVTWLQSAYLDGMVYGIGLRRDLLDGKLSAGVKYHYVDHYYRSAETDVAQHVGEAGLSWNICGKLSLTVHYEGTFEPDIGYNRVFAGLSQRF